MRCRSVRRVLGLGAGLLLLFAGCRPGPEREEYLSAEERRAVETLKREARSEPTTAENLAPRARLLWEWANRLALAGEVLPVNLTLTVGRALGVDHTGEPLNAASLTFLDHAIRELEVKDEQPDAIGTLAFASEEPLLAGSRVTIEQTYTVGSMPMRTGGAVLLGRQLMADQAAYQNEDPAAHDYVSIRASNPDVRFAPTREPLLGMHGGFRRAVPMPAFRLEEGELEPGESFTVTYGDASGGSSGFRIQTHSTDQLLLPLYVDLEGEGNFFTPRWPGLSVVGREPVGVRGTAPSIVAAGEPFELAVRIEDRYLNRASGPLPEIRLFLNDAPHSTLPAGRQALRVISDLRLDEPGIYRFSFDSQDGALTGSSNPIWVEDAPEQRIYWGETHGHTGFAEGQGTPEHYYRFARDDARLDFASLSEHDIWLDDAEWRTMQELARSFTEEGRFIAYLGYEWSARRQWGGHHNVFFRDPGRERVGVQSAPLLDMLYEQLHACCDADEVLVIPHAHQAADWTRSDPELERLVEMYSMHGTFEWFANLYLQNGFEVGFIAASDDHRARPGLAHGIPRAPLAQFGGLAAVWAPEKGSDAIFAAMRNLAAYATSGPRILLEATLNGAPMGTRLEATDRRQLRCRVSGSAPIDRIEVIKNGEVLFAQSYLTTRLAPRSTVQVGFESSSEVFSGRDNPRPYRIWEGVLTVRGARVVGVDAPGFDNLYLEHARLDAADAGRIHFRTETRGRMDTILVELEGASAATVFDLHLEANREYGFAPVLVRRPADLPAADLSLRLADASGDGRTEALFEVGEHTDRITVQVIDPRAPLDRQLEFTDLADPAPGDYYYVRVSQVDGGRAWSSPFWVGQKAGGG